MHLTDKKVAEKLAAFDKEQEPALVQEALEMIEAGEQDAPAGDRSAQMRGLSRWLLFFATIDRHIDPSWDENKVPVTGITPPQSQGVYFSGVDPSVIEDPIVRLQYEQALKASKDYAEWYRVQLLLRRIDEKAMGDVGRLLAEMYTSSSANSQELERLLKESLLGNERKERLRALMPRRS